MNRRKFEQIKKATELENKITIEVPYEVYLEAKEEISKKVKYTNEMRQDPWIRNHCDLIELAMIGLGTLSLSFEIKDAKKDKEKISVPLFGLLTQMSNELLALLLLTTNSLDYQTGSAKRDLFEMGLVLINILLNDDKRKGYFTHMDPKDSYQFWKTELRFSKLNDALQQFDEQVADKEIAEVLRTWREKFYNRQSKYTHSDSFRIFSSSFTRVKNEKDHYRSNLWGMGNTRTYDDLKDINEYIFIFLKYLIRIIATKELKKELEIHDEEIWQIAIELLLMYENNYLKVRIKEAETFGEVGVY